MPHVMPARKDGLRTGQPVRLDSHPVRKAPDPCPYFPSKGRIIAGGEDEDDPDRSKDA